MALHKIINVSFPRSGHHMLRDILQNYFGNKMKYCKWSDDFNQRPHLCPETNFTMVHDLHLTFPTTLNLKYLVLTRHPIYSLASWRIHQKEPLVVEDYDKSIAKKKLLLWTEWTNKWVLGGTAGLIVQYESILSEPIRVMSKVIEFCSDTPIDTERLEASLAIVGPRHIPNDTDKWVGWL